MENATKTDDKQIKESDSQFDYPEVLPETASTQGDEANNGKPAEKTVTYEAQIEQVANSSTKDAEGKVIFPEGTDPQLEAAARIEVRRRSIQSEADRVKHREKVLRESLENMQKDVGTNVRSFLNDDQNQELDELKTTDPDEYHKKLSAYEVEVKARYSADMEHADEMSKREVKVRDLHRRTGIILDESVVKTQLPAYLEIQLIAGEITFDFFVDQAEHYLTAKKTVTNPKDPITKETADPNLGKEQGTTTPQKEKGSEENPDWENDVNW